MTKEEVVTPAIQTPSVPRKKKNWMRNKQCPCGSGKKFKKCCSYKYTERGELKSNKGD